MVGARGGESDRGNGRRGGGGGVDIGRKGVEGWGNGPFELKERKRKGKIGGLG